VYESRVSRQIGLAATRTRLTSRLLADKYVLVSLKTKFARDAALLVIAALNVSRAYGQQSASDQFSYALRPNRTWSSPKGDRITVEEIRGPSANWIAGALYEVTGTYELRSQGEATLGLFVTSMRPGDGGRENTSRQQVMSVSNGKGQFKLFVRISHEFDCQIGGPHVDFYPVPSGKALIGNTYFANELACFARNIPLNETTRINDAFAHVVQLNRTWSSPDGDGITIEEVRGPSTNWMAGGQYEIIGTYNLMSHDRAALALSVSPSGSSGPSDVAVSAQQMVVVAKGAGQFRLRLFVPQKLADCRIGSPCGPHIALYSAAGKEPLVRADL
jgi:hypothetical protein